MYGPQWGFAFYNMAYMAAHRPEPSATPDTVVYGLSFHAGQQCLQSISPRLGLWDKNGMGVAGVPRCCVPVSSIRLDQTRASQWAPFIKTGRLNFHTQKKDVEELTRLNFLIFF
jgi:hypothetical protein